MEQQITSFILNIVDYCTSVGPWLGCLLIIIEPMIPILPLSVFIAINVIAFGFIVGFIISYISTIIGCLLAFTLVRKVFKKPFLKRVNEDSKMHRFMHRITKLKYSSLVLILAMPFTPAFLVNICAALSHMTYRKFLAAVLVGKLASVFFWGFVGDSLLESIKNPIVLAEIVLMLIITFILSKIVTKKFQIE